MNHDSEKPSTSPFHRERERERRGGGILIHIPCARLTLYCGRIYEIRGKMAFHPTLAFLRTFPDITSGGVSLDSICELGWDLSALALTLRTATDSTRTAPASSYIVTRICVTTLLQIVVTRYGQVRRATAFRFPLV